MFLFFPFSNRDIKWKVFNHVCFRQHDNAEEPARTLNPPFFLLIIAFVQLLPAVAAALNPG